MERVNELLPLVDNNTPDDDPNLTELDSLSHKIIEYENVHYPIGKPYKFITSKIV